MKIFKQIITLALTIVSVATMAQSNGGFELKDSSGRGEYIGLSLSGDMSIDFDPAIEQNPLKISTYIIPEYGYAFQNDVFVSGLIGVKRTHWNLEYASQKYNWTEVFVGLKVGKQFGKKSTQYVLSVSPRYHYQWFKGSASSIVNEQEYSWYAVNLSNGILLFKDKRLNVIPKIDFIYEIKPASVNIPRDITQLKSNLLIEFRYNLK